MKHIHKYWKASKNICKSWKMIFANLGKCLNNLQLLEVSKHICNIWKVSKVFTSLGKCVRYLQVLESVQNICLIGKCKNICKCWKASKVFTSLGKCKNICKWSKRVWQAASGRGRRSTFEPSTGFRAHTLLLPLLTTSLLAPLATR